MKKKLPELMRYEYTVQKMLPDFLFGHGQKMTEGWDSRAEIGDLVMLQAAPQSDWHLSFYCGPGDGLADYLLESLKTGRLCNWSNVRLLVVSRKWVSERPRIKWTDAQFRFAKRFDAEVKRARYHTDLPFIEEFTEESLVIGTRTRYNMTDDSTRSDPMPWKKMTRTELQRVIAERVAAHKWLRESRKPEAPG